MVWLVTPAVACAIASVVLATPIRVLGLQPPEPVFAMAPAFAWAVLRPSLLPPFALAALGLFEDALWGTPLGLWPLCLFAVYGTAFAIRRVLIGEDFWALGAWYAALCALAFGAGLLLTLFVSGQIPTLVGLGLQLLVTVMLFPLAWLVIDRFEDAAGRRY